MSALLASSDRQTRPVLISGLVTVAENDAQTTGGTP